MERLNWLLLYLLLGTSSAEECPLPFISLGDECYYFNGQETTWLDARETCLGMSATGSVDLAVLDVSSDDYVHIFNHATTLGQIHWWLGGTDAVQEGYWTWIDGRPIDMVKSYWRHDEPDVTTGQNCLAMWLASDESYPRWRIVDTECDIIDPFICQFRI